MLDEILHNTQLYILLIGTFSDSGEDIENFPTYYKVHYMYSKKFGQGKIMCKSNGG